MRYPILICAFIISYSHLNAQENVCDCYSKVAGANFNSQEFQHCLDLHENQFKSHENEMMKLFRAGKRDEVAKRNDDPKKWRECMKPATPEHSNKLQVIVSGVEHEVEIYSLEGHFTKHNEFNNQGYIETEIYNYDAINAYETPEDGIWIKISIVHSDSLNIEDFPFQKYPVKREGIDDDWFFYVEYQSPWGKYNGNYHKSKPSEESYLTLKENNGRYWIFEFHLITEEGQEIIGDLLVEHSIPLR